MSTQIFHIFDWALIGEGHLLERGAYFKILKNGIQIFHMHFEIKYHPSIFQKYRRTKQKEKINLSWSSDINIAV